jgi:hypothetical protein
VGRFVPLILLAALLAACGAEPNAKAPPTAEATPAAAAPTPEITGATAPQRALLADLLEGMRGAELEGIEIKAAGRRWVPSKPGDVDVRITWPDHNPRGRWEAWLLASVFAERSADKGLPPVIALAAAGDAVRLAGIGQTDEQDAEIEIPPGPQDPERVADEMQALAEGAEALLVDIDVLTPGGVTAPSLTLRVDDPGAFLDDRLQKLLGGFRGRYVSWHAIVVGPDGEAAWTGSSVHNRYALLSSQWVRPDLEGCITQYLPLDDSGSPPCPV